jgi:beta-lactam-binding protein with PASTA domain/tRNA A-37 threonylcarbamoyl transferase component Bud32
MPSITDSIGRVLGGRYRLVTALGTGASAHVYLADDVSLHRRVAIKVLHPALAGDANFLKRFRAEARAVAALNHPNILQVFDWGEEHDEPYLVLEYLAGGSLRQVFDTGALLTPEQAVQVGLQAAAGLDYAHRRGLIHRDIKPANLLFDADGRLRIADFGLARALAEAAWTEPDGAILGTARYAAPEQVEGWVLDGKADVYALALVLYEAVTGETPFIGDTTIATLMARVGALLPEHDALGPLNDVLVWAAAPEPSERFDAAQLSLRLEEVATTLPEPRPIPIVDAVPVDEVDDVDRALVRPVRRPLFDGAAPDATELGVPAVVGASALDQRSGRKATKAKARPGRPSATTGGPIRARRRRWPWIAAIVVLVLALVAGGMALAVDKKLFTPSHPIPVLVGKTVAQARLAVRADKFTVRTTGHLPSITLAPGLILSQRPQSRAAGRPKTAKEGSTIGVVLSTGPPPVAIPPLTSFTSCAGAVAALNTVHLVGVCPASAQQYSSTVVAGAVLGSAPTGTAPYGSTVTVATSKGHAPEPIPAVTGSGTTYATAAAALSGAGFVPAQNNEYSPTVPTGQVISTTPDASAGPQPFGSKVVVNISLGPQPVIIPNESGQSVTAATTALTGLGLKVSGPYGPSGATTVLSTDPAAGTSVQPGTTVNLYTL